MLVSIAIACVVPFAQAAVAVPKASASHAPTVDVPLSLWTSNTYPDGKVFGLNYGLALGDYDGDGWVDVFNFESGLLYRNLQGKDWQLAANLNPLIMPGLTRYGSIFGDFAGTGFPGLASEPRKDAGGNGCLSLLENLGTGGPFFREIADQPARVDVQPCLCLTETNNWADVDGDGWIDLFMPTYPPPNGGSIGNRLLKNLGRVTPAGNVAFSDVSDTAGITNAPGANRPEGAQFVDLDDDGDLDLYVNESIYQNISKLGVPRFNWLSPSESGITQFGNLDEGAALCDYDMDGDIDLLVAFTSGTFATIYENRGDGTFFEATGVVDNPQLGTSLGMGLADWDNDGDVDWTTSSTFRQNRMVEDGVRHFTVATTNLNPSWLGGALPSWFDFDHDGDLDCAMGHYAALSRMLQNDLYDASTPLIAKRYVRVRPLRPSSSVPHGLDNEFGAKAEITLVQGGDGHRRVKFVESGTGYLNQNDYTITFGLPATPTDLVFNVSVDFPVVAGRGVLRVDEHVNPALGGIHLATLINREIEVLRDGRVRVEGIEYAPTAGVSPWLSASAGGLNLVAPGVPLASPTPTTLPDTWVVLGVSTVSATAPLFVRQIDLDGQLDSPVVCDGTSTNFVVWDVTDPAHPTASSSDRSAFVTDPRNDRSHFRTNFVLQPGREYRAAARVTAFRKNLIQGALASGGLTVRGSAIVQAASACSVSEIANAVLDPTLQYLSLRVVQ